MRISVFSGSFAACLTLMAAADQSPAHACGQEPCFTGAFVPEDGATIPANTPALLWRTPMDHRIAGGTYRRPPLQLHRLEGTEREAVAFTLEEVSSGVAWIRPAALVAGARYRLETTAAECTTSPVEFEVGPEAPLPASLGSSNVDADRRQLLSVWTSSGRCFAPLPVSLASVSLEYAPEAVPWQAMLQFRTQVDGKPWVPSFEHRFEGASTLVYADCSMPSDMVDPGITDRGLSAGEHQLSIEAELPGADRLRTPETAFHLHCAPTVAGKRPEFAAASCSASPATERSELALLLILGTLLSLRLRRRRSYRLQETLGLAQDRGLVGLHVHAREDVIAVRDRDAVVGRINRTARRARLRP